MRNIEETIEKGERCRCGGEIDSLYLIQSNPDVWVGRCFQCGKRLAVIPEGGQCVRSNKVS